MKLHLRTIKMRRVQYRLITLRPHSEVAYSTNYFHSTWHVLSDQHGAQLLARLMWGLSFQQAPGTSILIHGEHLKPTPFGAEPSNPILLTNAGQTKIDAKSLKVLRRHLKNLGPPHCTVRWHTFSLDANLKRELQRGPYNPAFEHTEDDWVHYEQNKHLWKDEKMFRCGGFVCYSAPPKIMRHRALAIAQLDPSSYGMDYYYIADRNNQDWPAGEVQIFSDYQERRSAASEARKQVLKEGHKFSDPESMYAVVAELRDNILTRRRSARRQTRCESNK